MTSPYKIALIVLYFGPLPPYFPVWLKSAEANPDVDFLVWSDQDIRTDAPNFCVRKCALTDLRERFSKTLNRPLQIPNGYKLCDYRPAYGVLFEEELRGYDFWGHCDIDLVFGQIRRFLTDEILSAYDRFYAYGPLSVYRNNETMRRAFELPGSVYTPDETFGPFHVGADEYVGINRICVKNRIPWYTAIDFARICGMWPERQEIANRQRNYTVQVFYWVNGLAFQRYLDGNALKDRELLYVHWHHRNPVPESSLRPGEAVVVTNSRLLIRPTESLTPRNMRRWNPPIGAARKFFYKIKTRALNCLPFLTGNSAFKKIWLKRQRFKFLETKFKKLPYL